MRKLKRIYRDYLRKIGKLDGELRLGKRGDSRGVEYEEVLIHESELLKNRLEKRFRLNNKTLILANLLLCILFAIGVYLNFYYNKQPEIMGGILGGTFLVLLSIIKWLHTLWQEKSIMDISMTILVSISPEEAAEFFNNLYRKLFIIYPVKKILILASNPKTTPKLRLDEEVREIDEGLRRSKHRDRFEIHTKLAVRLRDLRRALLDVEPQIVHFTGHGKEDGLLVEDELGMAVRISAKALAGLFALCADQVECVILSACFSAPQATAIRKHIHYVIGMRKEIEDAAAIEFAVGFYDALGAGRTVEDAFEFGRNAVLQVFPDQTEHLIPVFKKRKGLKKQKKQDS